MEKQIKELESKLIKQKPWELRGEVKAKERPLNSLLQDHFDFETAAPSKPDHRVLYSDQVVSEIESLIIQRIKDGQFDDVQPKQPPKQERLAQEIDFMEFEKAKKSLMEVYEEDY